MKPASNLRAVSCALFFSTLAFAIPNHVAADFIVTSRLSEIDVSTVNLGGFADSESTFDTALAFNEVLDDSTSHTEPGGNINLGTWFVQQDTTLAADAINATMFAEGTVQRVFGSGAGLVNSSSLFEIEFEVSEMTRFDLGGALSGTTDNVGADDFVRVQLQEFNGISFINMFSTSTGADLSAGHTGLFLPGELYRLEVFARGRASGEDSNQSSVTAFLQGTAVPEPGVTIVPALGLMMLASRRRSRGVARHGSRTSIV